MRALLLAGLVCASGCTPANYYTVKVQKEPGIPGAWTTQDQTVILRGFENVARVEFDGRVYVIENFDPFRGYIDPEGGVYLSGNQFEVRITRELFEIGFRNAPPMRWSVSELPKDKIIVCSGRELRFEEKE